MSRSQLVGSSRAGVEALLKPRSVAIVGATPKVDTLGGRPIANLRTQGFAGRIYPVNPRYGEVLGLPCFPDLRALPEAPDLVLVIVGQDRVFATLDDAVAVGAKTALVFGAGFAEVGAAGIARQEELAGYAARGLRICGPNTNGVFSVANRTALGFAPTFELQARRGRIAIISQSGNINTCVSSRGMELGLGFSHLICSGNEVDLELSDYIEYLLDDEQTDVFALFVEGFKNPQRFFDVAQEALRRGKPIVLMKMGRTESSQRVALSHTGSMTGSYSIITSALRQRGVVVVDGLDELCAVSSVLATGKRPCGGAVAVASLSGGMAGIVADLCQDQSVSLAQFRPETRERIASQLPGIANLDNPLDVTGQVVNEPGCWTNSIKALADDAGVDAVLSVLSITANQTERRFAQDLVDLSNAGKVLSITVWPSALPAGSGFDVLQEAGVPVVMRAQDAVLAIAAWRNYWSTRDDRLAAQQAQGERVAGLARASGMGSPWTLLEEAGIPIARHAILRDRKEIAGALDRLTLPVALKLDADALAHKTEIGALRLGLRNIDEVVAAWDALSDVASRNLPDGAPWSMMVQEMHSGKRELILGLKHEPGVGLAVMIGLGGIFSEVLKDFAVRVAPLSPLDAKEMIAQLRGAAMLKEVRGLGAVPDSLLVGLLMNLSDLAMRHDSVIEELDINPMVIRDDGQAVTAVDVLLRYRDPA